MRDRLTGFIYDNPALAMVRANLARYDMLDDQVVFLQGWFRDTLPTAPIAKLAILRLDGDLEFVISMVRASDGRSASCDAAHRASEGRSASTL